MPTKARSAAPCLDAAADPRAGSAGHTCSLGHATFPATRVLLWVEVDQTDDQLSAVEARPVQDTRRVFLAHHGRLLRLCALLTGSPDAGEDLAQEAFARALMRASGLPEDEQYPYLRATASNIWKNRL